MFFKYVFLWLILICHIWICQLPQITNTNATFRIQLFKPVMFYIIICFFKRHIFKLILLLHKPNKVFQKHFRVSILLTNHFTSILYIPGLIQIIGNFSGQNAHYMFNFLYSVVVVGSKVILRLLRKTFTQINFWQSFCMI